MGGGVKRYDIIAFNFKPCPNFNASINCLSNLTSKRVPLKYRPGVVDLRGGGGGGRGPYTLCLTSNKYLPLSYQYITRSLPRISEVDLSHNQNSRYAPAPILWVTLFVPLKSTSTSNKPLA